MLVSDWQNTEKLSKALSALYPDDTRQVARYQQLLDRYLTRFADDEIALFSSCGRMELIGNHTDHQGGEVLAAAIQRDIIAAVSKSEDIVLYSEDFSTIQLHPNDTAFRIEEAGSSLALVKGILQRFKLSGYPIGGFHAVVSSDILQGYGMSSSAAFELLIVAILWRLYRSEVPFDLLEMAKIAQYAENEYFKKPCGLLDQLVSAIGGIVHLNLADRNKPQIERLSIETLNEYRFLLLPVGENHTDLSSYYADIVREMQLIATHYQKKQLADVSREQFYREYLQLAEQYGDRTVLRAHHFFTENQRVIDAVEALKTQQTKRLPELLSASGRSSALNLQNLSCYDKPQNQRLRLVESILEHHFGYNGISERVHGGGFGGTLLICVPKEQLTTVQTTLAASFLQMAPSAIALRDRGITCLTQGDDA